MRTRTNRPPRLWPMVAIAVGVLLLLSNFQITTFDVLQLWPVLLIALGVQLLGQGDLGLTWQGQSFGITRGSVHRATLEADSGEVDLNVRALRREGRLLAGQYTARSRPRLEVQHSQASLHMRRGETWLLSLADWEVGLARDLPWRLLLSAHLGQLNADLRSLNVHEARLATGIGDIKLVCPDSSSGPIWVRSTLGNISLEVPDGVEAAVRVHSTALSQVRVSNRFDEAAPGLWVTDGSTGEDGTISVEVVSVVGDVSIE